MLDQFAGHQSAKVLPSDQYLASRQYGLFPRPDPPVVWMACSMSERTRMTTSSVERARAPIPTARRLLWRSIRRAEGVLLDAIGLSVKIERNIASVLAHSFRSAIAADRCCKQWPCASRQFRDAEKMAIGVSWPLILPREPRRHSFVIGEVSHLSSDCAQARDPAHARAGVVHVVVLSGTRTQYQAPANFGPTARSHGLEAVAWDRAGESIVCQRASITSLFASEASLL
jgi:hypothetical protein